MWIGIYIGIKCFFEFYVYVGNMNIKRLVGFLCFLEYLDVGGFLMLFIVYDFVS